MALPPRAAGMSEPIQVYQDAFFNQATPMISHAPMPSVPKPPQRRLMQSTSNGNAGRTSMGVMTNNGGNNNNNNNSSSSSSSSINNSSSGGNITIHPPVQPAIKPSPSKATTGLAAASPRTPLRPSQSHKLNAVSFQPPAEQGRSTDSLQKKQPLMSRFKTVAQAPPVDMGSMSSSFMGKENHHAVIFPAPPGLNVSIESYYQKAPGKRLLEPAPIRDGRPIKRPRTDDEALPSHDSFPPIADDGSKPGHSYAMLIGMAILRSPGRKLTLSQIYKWISDTYSFYNPQDAGWQNSIRHNLSLNKAFVKQERPKDDPGKGNYWAIEAGMECLFMKDKAVRKPAGVGDNLQLMSTTLLEPSLPPMPASFQESVFTPRLPPMPRSVAEPPSAAAPTDTVLSTNPPQPEPSSDATIIVSDTAAPDEQQPPSVDDKTTGAPLPEAVPADVPALDSSQFSPVPATALHSSPPISRHIEAHSGTPPPAPRALLASSVNRSRKRKSASMDDSGYISSLESSALRSNQNRHLPSESGDRSRIKRGRAEEEIARLRASSYDSPTKGRLRSGYHPTSSSPLRRGSLNENASSQMPPPPLTPAVKLKAPIKPPPSVSPGTNLRMHRDKVRHMLASPLRRIASATDDVQGWGSPTAFDESLYNFTDETDFALDTSNLSGAFEIFQDDSLPNLFPSVHNGSPTKPPSSKRLRLDRSYSVSALSDVTNSAVRRNITSAPFLKVPTQSPGSFLDTPSKFFDGLPSSPSKFFNLQSPSKAPTSAADPASFPTSIALALHDENSWVPLDDFCAPNFLQDVDEFGGLDILQGFEKIGSNCPPQQLFSVPPQPRLMPQQQQQHQQQQHQHQHQQHQQHQQQQHARAPRGPSKAVLGRSYTTTF
ncbi:forkhead transcription factor [Niveomyces insectorum RCEF 264]|uniref:Forkhead transcription factor n=1 Tax=Niveomyces insectorum RCEF 264 TaxID=1081102 RepID=A0A167PH37_9HYPO|nr:forkhead transcription factor [Niveomyces insectorum RCEF 264]